MERLTKQRVKDLAKEIAIELGGLCERHHVEEGYSWQAGNNSMSANFKPIIDESVKWKTCIARVGRKVYTILEERKLLSRIAVDDYRGNVRVIFNVPNPSFRRAWLPKSKTKMDIPAPLQKVKKKLTEKGYRNTIFRANSGRAGSVGINILEAKMPVMIHILEAEVDIKNLDRGDVVDVRILRGTAKFSRVYAYSKGLTVNKAMELVERCANLFSGSTKWQVVEGEGRPNSLGKRDLEL